MRIYLASKRRLLISGAVLAVSVALFFPATAKAAPAPAPAFCGVARPVLVTTTMAAEIPGAIRIRTASGLADVRCGDFAATASTASTGAVGATDRNSSDRAAVLVISRVPQTGGDPWTAQTSSSRS